MDKRRLTLMLDGMTLLALIWMVEANINIPYPRTAEGFWNMHREIFRTGTSALWLIALWAGGYAAWDRAERIGGGAVPLVALTTLCLLVTPWCTRLIIYSYKARISQAIYGVAMMAGALCELLLHRSLERANAHLPACVAASKRFRRALWLALGLMAAGMAVSMLRYRPAMYCSVAAAAVGVAAVCAPEWVGRE